MIKIKSFGIAFAYLDVLISKKLFIRGGGFMVINYILDNHGQFVPTQAYGEHFVKKGSDSKIANWLGKTVNIDGRNLDKKSLVNYLDSKMKELEDIGISVPDEYKLKKGLFDSEAKVKKAYKFIAREFTKDSNFVSSQTQKMHRFFTESEEETDKEYLSMRGLRALKSQDQINRIDTMAYAGEIGRKFREISPDYEIVSDEMGQHVVKFNYNNDHDREKFFNRYSHLLDGQKENHFDKRGGIILSHQETWKLVGFPEHIEYKDRSEWEDKFNEIMDIVIENKMYGETEIRENEGYKDLEDFEVFTAPSSEEIYREVDKKRWEEDLPPTSKISIPLEKEEPNKLAIHIRRTFQNLSDHYEVIKTSEGSFKVNLYFSDKESRENFIRKNGYILGTSEPELGTSELEKGGANYSLTLNPQQTFKLAGFTQTTRMPDNYFDAMKIILKTKDWLES